MAERYLLRQVVVLDPGQQVGDVVAAIVGNDDGELLLVQRADSGIWLYPTGWADVGYSPAEVAVKVTSDPAGTRISPGMKDQTWPSITTS